MRASATVSGRLIRRLERVAAAKLAFFVWFGMLVAIASGGACGGDTSSDDAHGGSSGGGGSSAAAGTGASGVAGAGGSQGGNGGLGGAAGKGGESIDSGASGGAGNAGAPGCTLESSGTCTPSGPNGCCPVMGKYWLLKDSPPCKLELPTVNGVVHCVVISSTGCTSYPAETCHTRVTSDGTEVLIATDYWKPEQLGPDWSACTQELRDALDAAAVCS